MSARSHGIRLAGFTCGGRDMLLQVPDRDVRIGPCGVEFQSPYPLPLWAELEVELSRGPGNGRSVHQVVVVACDPAGPGRSRIALLFVDQDAATPRPRPVDSSRDN